MDEYEKEITVLVFLFFFIPHANLPPAFPVLKLSSCPPAKLEANADEAKVKILSYINTPNLIYKATITMRDMKCQPENEQPISFTSHSFLRISTHSSTAYFSMTC